MHRAALKQNAAEAGEKKESALHALYGLTSASENRNAKTQRVSAIVASLRVARDTGFPGAQSLRRPQDGGYTVAITAVATEGGNGCFWA